MLEQDENVFPLPSPWTPPWFKERFFGGSTKINPNLKFSATKLCTGTKKPTSLLGSPVRQYIVGIVGDRGDCGCVRFCHMQRSMLECGGLEGMAGLWLRE